MRIKGMVALALALAAGTAAAQDTRLGDLRSSRGVTHGAVCSAAPKPGHARCLARVVTDPVGNALSGDAARVALAQAAGSLGDAAATPDALPAGYGPAQLIEAYRVPPGAGTLAFTIAIVDAYGYPNAEADLAVYRATYGLPPCTTANGCFAKFNQTGAAGPYPPFNTGWAQEAALDLQMASAVCPGPRNPPAPPPPPPSPTRAAAARPAARLGAGAISNSYGGDEAGTASFASAYDQPGVAVTASSGDSGYGVSAPAAFPAVVAVGGTRLVRSSNGRGWTEDAWDGAGSGCSAIFAKPAWQTDARCPRRMVADVSAVSDPATGVAVYAPVSAAAAAWRVFGGTSAAAPIIAGVYGARGGPVVAGSAYANPGGFYDVVGGTNGTCPVNYFCRAVRGYDGPTGLGGPKGTSAF